MSGTHAVLTSSASVDGTAGTFARLATGDPVALDDRAKQFLGVCFTAAPLAIVAAKPASLRLKLTSTSLDIVGEVFTYGAGYGGGIATNDQQTQFPVDFIQFDIAATGGEKCSADVTVHTSGDTSAWSAITSWVHRDDDKPDADLNPFWGDSARPPVQGGDSNMASVSTTTRTTLNDLNIAGKFLKVVYLTTEVFPIAVPAAAAAVVGSVEMTSAIPGVAPANFPHPSWGPTLGTPVGQAGLILGTRVLPFYLARKEGKDRTITGFANEILTPNTAVIVNYSCGYRKT
jgi:hypothetical protein